jgi:hypothetical protein
LLAVRPRRSPRRRSGPATSTRSPGTAPPRAWLPGVDLGDPPPRRHWRREFIGALLGEVAENADGDELRDAHALAYSDLIGEVEAIEGASELIGEHAEVGSSGRAAAATVVISSSGEQDEIDRYVDLPGVRERSRGDDLRRRRAHRVRPQTGAGGAPEVRVGRPDADDRRLDLRREGGHGGRRADPDAPYGRLRGDRPARGGRGRGGPVDSRAARARRRAESSPPPADRVRTFLRYLTISANAPGTDLT